jgi:hypothetical protein
MKTAGLIFLIAVMFIPFSQLKELEFCWLRLPGNGWGVGETTLEVFLAGCQTCSIHWRFKLIVR